MIRSPFLQSMIVVFVVFVVSTMNVLNSFPIISYHHHEKFTRMVYQHGISSSSILSATKMTGNKKGFGNEKKNNSSQQQQEQRKNGISSRAEEKWEVTDQQTITSTTLSSQSLQVKEQDESSSKLNTGQMALAKLRRERAEQRDAELRQVRDMIQMEEQGKQSVPSIPEPVAMRMGQRMLPFVGIPFFLGIGTFVGFWYMATYRDMEFQPALVATSTIILLGFGLLVRFCYCCCFWIYFKCRSFVFSIKIDLRHSKR
jgi:Photosynthesis affected mutant 68